MPVYSFGTDSPLKFELTDEFAEAYNRAIKAFFEAQIKFKEDYGFPWKPELPIHIKCSEDDMATFNSFAHILKEALSRYGKPVHEDELTDDYLIKNV